ncbi:MAG: flagellar hook protein FlgE [Syntrophorhabdales bacterium]|jgi:flagellar hook protein FlgE
MLTSLDSGISGLLANSEALDIVGNNISNSNTTGFKASSASFQDVLYQTITGANGTGQVGTGVALGAVQTDFSQGSVETTDSATDLAIGGQGFFIVKKAGDNTDYYTRDGGFSFDKTGNLVDANGDYVQGKAIDQTTGTATGVDQNITISQQPSQPKATQNIDMVVNLESDSAWKGECTVTSGTDLSSIAAATSDYPATGNYTLNVTGPATDGTFPVTVTMPDGTVVTGTATSNGNNTDFTGTDSSGNTVDTGLNLSFGTLANGDTTNFTLSGFDGTSAATQSNTSNYSSSETVYDSLGTAHTVTVNFREASVDSTSQTSTWDWNVTVSGADKVVSGGSGTMTFNENGVLTSGGSPQAVTFNFAGAQQNQTINLVMGSGSGEGSSTQYSSASTTTYVGQDGYAPGVLQSESVSSDGIISGTYNNGQILQLYQLTLANFDNPQGLNKVGGNLYSATLDSGNAYTNAPGQGGTGTISSNSLEESNVDLATEFVNMITYQSGYEANSKVITTTDQILQDLMNIIHD